MLRYFDPIAKRFPYLGGGGFDAKTLNAYSLSIPTGGYTAKQSDFLVGAIQRILKALNTVRDASTAKGAWSYADLESAGLLRNICGILVVLDRPIGTVQCGVDANGNAWERVYSCDYGFLPDTISPDGEEIDAYVGTIPDAPLTFIIQQLKQDGTDDEPKFMFGFGSVWHAIDAFLKHMPAWALGSVAAVQTSVIAGLLNIAPTSMLTACKAMCGGKKAIYNQPPTNVAKSADFQKLPLVVSAERVEQPTVIHTLEGDMRAQPGDWIITGILGERYPCDQEAFRLTFVPVNEEAQALWRAAYGDTPPPALQTTQDLPANDEVNDTHAVLEQTNDALASVEPVFDLATAISSIATGELVEWTPEVVDELPDGAFLYVAPGGGLDEHGKTTPRSLRHFPVYDAGGKLDLLHLRDALTRLGESGLPQEAMDAVRAEAERLLKQAIADAKSSDPPLEINAEPDKPLPPTVSGDSKDQQQQSAFLDNRKETPCISASQLHDLLKNALQQKFPRTIEPCDPCSPCSAGDGVWVVDVYDNFVVYERERVLWRIGYVYDVTSATVMLLGESQRVVRTYEVVPPDQPPSARTPIPMTREMIGYFDGAGDVPTCEPTDNRCALCGIDWTEDDVRTHSIMGLEGQAHGWSLFYRTHRTCAEAVGDGVYELDTEVFAIMDSGSEVRMSRGDQVVRKSFDGRVAKSNITIEVAAPALAQPSQPTSATPVTDMLGRPTILMLRSSGISGDVAERAVDAMRKLQDMPPELAASFNKMVVALDSMSATNKELAKPIDSVPELADHPARSWPLTGKYDHPENVGGWLGWIEPPNNEWIAFVSTGGDALLWTMREPNGGVIGEPFALQRPDLIASSATTTPNVLPTEYGEKSNKAQVTIVAETSNSPLVTKPYDAFNSWDEVVRVLRARGRSGDDVADIIKSLCISTDERRRALATTNAFDSFMRWDGNTVPFRKAGNTEHPVVEASLDLMFAAPEEMGGWIGWIEPPDQRWFAIVDADGIVRVWLLRDANGAVLGPAYELKRKDLRQEKPNEKSDPKFDQLISDLAKSPPKFLRNDDGTFFTAKGIDASGPKRLVYAVVLEPNPNDGAGDAQQHTYDEQFCEEACHYFARFLLLKDNHGDRGVVLPKDRAYVAQNFVAPCEFTLGSQKVKKGSWVMAACIPDDECWAKVESGEWNAFSIEGHSTHTQIAI